MIKTEAAEQPRPTFPDYYRSPPDPKFQEGSAVQITGQTHRLDLNNRMAVVVGRDGLRTLVMTATGDTLSIADTQLKEVQLQPGSRVTIVGLKSAVQHNGQVGTIIKFSDDRWNVGLQEQDGSTTAISVKPINVILTPHVTQDAAMAALAFKRRRELAPPRPAIRPMPTQALAVDLSIVLSPHEPILKRCGSLRKIIFACPGFACKAVAVLGVLSNDAKLSSRGFISQDHLEGRRLSDIVTGGRQDGELRTVDLFHPELSPVTDRCMVIADRHSTAAHLIAAIDDNVATIQDTMRILLSPQQQQIPQSNNTN